MTYKDALIRASQYLKTQQIEDPSHEAGLLLSYCINKDLSFIYAHTDELMLDDQIATFDSIVKRRGRHEPYAYITGECGFMDLSFHVNEHVLIPRPDTEILVQGALYALGLNQEYFNQEMFKLPPKPAYQALDVGTGSGCIAISLARSMKSLTVDALDISPLALEVAKKNTNRHGVNERVNFIEADFLNTSLSGKYDLIVSNPPYITISDMLALMPSVKHYEPHLALEAGDDGLIFYHALAQKSKDLLFADGILIIECGYNQAEQVGEILNQNNFQTLILIDLSSTSRVVCARAI